MEKLLRDFSEHDLDMTDTLRLTEYPIYIVGTEILS